MAKYTGKNDLERGVMLEIIKNIERSFGTLNVGSRVTLIEVTHFPTSYKVIDEYGKSWILRTYDVRLLNDE